MRYALFADIQASRETIQIRVPAYAHHGWSRASLEALVTGHHRADVMGERFLLRRRASFFHCTAAAEPVLYFCGMWSWRSSAMEISCPKVGSRLRWCQY